MKAAASIIDYHHLCELVKSEWTKLPKTIALVVCIMILTFIFTASELFLT